MLRGDIFTSKQAQTASEALREPQLKRGQAGGSRKAQPLRQEEHPVSMHSSHNPMFSRLSQALLFASPGPILPLSTIPLLSCCKIETSFLLTTEY
jgi:hypothetical protein